LSLNPPLQLSLNPPLQSRWVGLSCTRRREDYL
jgi:hypothetical protein